MSQSSDRPYFQPSLRDKFTRGDAFGDDRVHVALEGLSLGEHWTTQGLLDQARFLVDYSSDPKRHAAWLMALSACTANDETTGNDLSLAIDRGLALDEAARIAVFSNSGAAAIALAARGVDWSTQKILPIVARFANDPAIADQPNQALIEHAMRPAHAAGRYQTIVEPVLAIEVALRWHRAFFERTPGFLEGIVQAGVALDTRINTHALGLESGSAALLSLCIANRALDFITPRVDGSLDQDTLDEALLACAMTCGLATGEGTKEFEVLVGKLEKLGANRDRSFQFSPIALEALDVLPGMDMPEGSPPAGSASARQWFTHTALLNQDIGEQDITWMLGPRPFRGAPGWGRWALLAYEAQMEDKPAPPVAHELLVGLLDCDPMPADAFRQLLRIASINVSDSRHATGPVLLDACLASRHFDAMKGQVPVSGFMDMIKDVFEIPKDWPKRDIPALAVSRGFAINIWRHPRLMRLAQVLPEEDLARFKQTLPLFLSALEVCFPATEDSQDPSKLSFTDLKRHRAMPSNQEAAQLAFSDLMASLRHAISPSSRARRSL